MPTHPTRGVLQLIMIDERTKVAGTTGSAVGLSAVASFVGLCCVGPWSVALFGVSGAITMARFDFLRPYILAAAMLMLGWTFWRVYRPQPVCTDGTCVTGASEWLKMPLWFVASLTGLVCLRDLLDGNTNPQLRTLIAHVPTLGAKAEHIPEAAELIPGGNVTATYVPKSTPPEDLLPAARW